MTPMPEIDQTQDALIVVDMQYDFMEEDGALSVPEGEYLRDPIIEMMDQFKNVIVTQDWHPADHISFASVQKREPFDQIDLYGHKQTLWPDHCVQGSKGARLQVRIMEHPNVIVTLRKGTNWRVDSYSAFCENWGPDGKRKDTGLFGFLFPRGIRRVFVCGLARDYCVKYTAIDAAIDGGAALRPHFLWDLTRAVNPVNDDITRHELLQAGVKIV